MTECPRCRRPWAAGGAACRCGWRPAALAARTETEPGAENWKEAVRAGVARHRQRRAWLTGAAEAPAPPPLRGPGSATVVPFARDAAATEEGQAAPPDQTFAAAEDGVGEATGRRGREWQNRSEDLEGRSEAAPTRAVPLVWAAAPARGAVAMPLASGGSAAARGVAAAALAAAAATVAPAVAIPAVRRCAGPERAAVEFSAPPLRATPPPQAGRAAAPLGRRLAAFLVDAGCGALAAAGFDLGLRIVSWALRLGAWGHGEWMVVAATGAAGFAVLQMLCLAAGLETPGMRCCGLALRGGEGQPVGIAAWRRRGGAMLLSIGALGLGFLWAYLDESHLTWHDRLSGTVLAPRRAAPQPPD